MENNLYKTNNSIYQDSDPRGSKLVTFLLLRSENPCLMKEEIYRTESELLFRKDSDLIKMLISPVHSPLMITKLSTF